MLLHHSLSPLSNQLMGISVFIIYNNENLSHGVEARSGWKVNAKFLVIYTVHLLQIGYQQNLIQLILRRTSFTHIRGFKTLAYQK